MIALRLHGDHIAVMPTKTPSAHMGRSGVPPSCACTTNRLASKTPPPTTRGAEPPNGFASIVPWSRLPNSISPEELLDGRTPSTRVTGGGRNAYFVPLLAETDGRSAEAGYPNRCGYRGPIALAGGRPSARAGEPGARSTALGRWAGAIRSPAPGGSDTRRSGFSTPSRIPLNVRNG
jgi:hypothetical protein